MRVSGGVRASARRIAVAASVAGVLFATAPIALAQQAAAAAPAQPAAADPLKFDNAEFVILLWQIKPEKADDFQALVKELKTKMAASEKPDVKAQGDGIRLGRVQTDPAQGPAIFLLFLEPPSTTLSYDPVKMIYESAGFTREEADALYKRLSEAHVQLAPWNVRRIG